MYKKAVYLPLGALALFGIGAAVVQATSYSSCTNSYQSGVAAPTGYGAAYDTVLGGLDVSIDCNSNTVTVGVGDRSQYVYKLGYVYQNGWQPLSLTGTDQLIANNWYNGSASANLGNVDLTETTYVVGYVCDWTSSVWKCGCADQACATPSWQLQTVRGTLVTDCTNPPGLSGSNCGPAHSPMQ